MKTVEQLMQEAFDRPRDPRSVAYKAGVRRALAFRLDGRLVCDPYPPGSAESDAFHAGTQEGHAIFRREQEWA
ncbi:hypothetical protein [Chitinimonas sp.]|uniref:hypothetical protein n=1 Tax=Chitinimonas sp. TaxID=1934313 RepID=UPI0035B2D8DA